MDGMVNTWALVPFDVDPSLRVGMPSSLRRGGHSPSSLELFLGELLGLDHGAGHPSRRRSSVEAPKCLKNWEFDDPFRHAWWPKVAGAVIEARVGIELKVSRERYRRKDLIDPVEAQLWKKYLRPSGCQHGLFVVLWFRDDQRYHGPRSWTNSKELAEELQKNCEELSRKHQVSLHAYVIDLITPVRER